MQTQNTEEIQIDSPYDIVMMPHIEQNVPIPKNAREALPDLTNEEEVEMLANTVKLISDFKTIIQEPNKKIHLKKYKNATLASLAGMVAELDAQVVDELKDLKTFVVNGLIREAATADKPKERITALRAIGDIDGVDAFKKHTEVVHKNMSMDDIESRLQTLVTKLQKRLDVKDSEVIDAEVVKDE